jgi:hypothetical protein
MSNREGWGKADGRTSVWAPCLVHGRIPNRARRLNSRVELDLCDWSWSRRRFVSIGSDGGRIHGWGIQGRTGESESLRERRCHPLVCLPDGFFSTNGLLSTLVNTHRPYPYPLTTSNRRALPAAEFCSRPYSYVLGRLKGSRTRILEQWLPSPTLLGNGVVPKATTSV